MIQGSVNDCDGEMETAGMSFKAEDFRGGGSDHCLEAATRRKQAESLRMKQRSLGRAKFLLRQEGEGRG